jgi:formyl-CoA transferase
VTRSPLLGEHTHEILSKVLGYTHEEVAAIMASGCTEPPVKKPVAAE